MCPWLNHDDDLKADVTHSEAKKLKATGVDVISVGVGKHADFKELKDIASNDHLVFRPKSFGELEKIRKELTTKACQTAQAPTTINRPLTVSLSVPRTFYLGVSCNMSTNTISLSPGAFYLGVDDAQFSAILFGSQVSQLFSFGQYTELDKISAALHGAQYSQGGSCGMAGAFQYAWQTSFTTASGARPDVPRVVILLTDSQAEN
ncbi:collagen alpha-6(VI) chain, partial [Aplysia californica]|uniref:Collagen alpha-6(VI) chain n=1 Tax=Aplysia californica TaxID=6500 RepID=A0ABM1AF92_APLCA